MIGQVVNEDGEVVETRDFGCMAEEEFNRILRIMALEYPDIVVQDVELTGN